MELYGLNPEKIYLVIRVKSSNICSRILAHELHLRTNYLIKNVLQTVHIRNYIQWLCIMECCGAVVKHRTRDREVPGLIPTNSKCCFLEQETLSTLLSSGFYPGKKRGPHGRLVLDY